LPYFDGTKAGQISGKRIRPPCVWPANVKATRAGTCGKMSGSCANSDQIVGGDLLKGPGQVVDAAEAADAVGNLIADAGDPESLALATKQHRVILQQRNAQSGKRLRTPPRSYHPAPLSRRAIIGRSLRRSKSLNVRSTGFEPDGRLPLSRLMF